MEADPTPTSSDSLLVKLALGLYAAKHRADPAPDEARVPVLKLTLHALMGTCRKNFGMHRELPTMHK